MSMLLYAVTDSASAQDMVGTVDAGAGPLEAVHAMGLAIVLGPAPKTRMLQRPKVAQLRQLVAFEQVLEALAPLGPILPVAPGVLVDNAEEALRCLAANVARLRPALEEFGERRQFQITIEWDPIKALERAKARDDFGDIRRLAERNDRKALGRAVQRAMETERQATADRYGGMISAAAEDTILLPAEGADAIINIVALIHHDDELRLDRAVEAVDASWPDALRIRYAGPLPPVSFAAVRLERPDLRCVQRASARLGVAPQASSDALRNAYRTLMKRAHPDMQPFANDTAAPRAEADADPGLLSEDYRLLLRLTEAREALAAFSNSTATEPPALATVCRQGDLQHAA